MYAIRWDSFERRVDTVEDVDRTLDELHDQYRRGRPTLVTVERMDSGDSLSVGLGAELSVLSLVRGDHEPPYYTSAGGSTVEGVVAFVYGLEWSEFPVASLVPVAAARAAMRRFCETGAQSCDVVWEEV